jgi:hypothetical protein
LVSQVIDFQTPDFRIWPQKGKFATEPNNVLRVNAPLTILLLSDTYGGHVHDKRMADATPYPLPARSRLLQDLGFFAFTLPQVASLMPRQKPRGQELTHEQTRANQAYTTAGSGSSMSTVA